MKKAILVCGVLALIALARWILLQPGAAWLGIDETVVNVAARQAGRAPCSPIINLARGDPELFFLAAGAIGGFVAGYHFRAVFVGKNPRSPKVGAR